MPHSRAPFAAALLVAGLLVSSVRAQAPPAVTGPLEQLSREARARVVPGDTLLSFRTRPVPDGRYDVEEGVLRAAYRLDPTAPPAATPELTARRYLSGAAEAFGWEPAAEDLELEAVQRTPHSVHLTFRQTYRGIPVYNRRVKVSLDGAGRPSMVLSGYAPHLKRVSSFDAAPALGAGEAARRARAAVEDATAGATEPELVVYPAKRPLLAWRAVVRSGAGAEWEVLVDAHTGALLQLVDLGLHVRKNTEPGAPERSGEVRGAAPIRTPRSTGGSAVDGRGLVFDPDPLTTAGVTYGGGYQDFQDADTPELTAELREVDLLDITLGSDGLYRLEGPFVRIDGSSEIGGTDYAIPRVAAPDGFRYTRSEPHFEAVMAYYHIDKNARYVRSLGVGHPTSAVRVNPHGLGSADDSRYFQSQHAIAFGDGGVDDAEDADVILHEYAHALMNESAPGLLSTSEGQALHEGWADYWAASYARALAESDPSIPADDWRHVFTWDGNVQPCWNGRTLDHTGRYPDDMEYPPEQNCNALSPVYQHGLLWATTLMEIYPHVERPVLDRLNVASHFYLTAPATFRDAAEALIQADRDLHGGLHAGTLVERLGARGYVNPADYGPLLEHEALSATEQLGGTRTLVVTASAATAAIDSVVVLYGYDAAPTRRLVLEALGDGRYGGELPLPEAPATVRYYVEATDDMGRRSWLPAESPAATFQFEAGPDLVPPVVTHDAPAALSVDGWPLVLSVGVRDNLGVDTVQVAYTIRRPDGVPQAEGSFGLRAAGGERYEGSFAAAGAAVEPGGTVAYRIVARDASHAQNETTAPAEGAYTIEILAEGPLRAYRFEGVEQPFTARGAWASGPPTYGLRVAHSGRNVWATDPDGSYPAHPLASTLEVPPLALDAARPAYLTFWHWYDTEHDGDVQPGRYAAEATLWDGGNVKVSTDGGQTWRILEPEGGYDAPIAAGYDNPLGGQPGFGGYSYGWRRAILPLPAGDEVRIRFDFGTDASNQEVARYYAGWYIDDVTITTAYPTDDLPPVVRQAPASPLVRPAGLTAPAFTFRIEDDTGVEAAFVDYTLRTAQGSEEDAMRLAMNEADADAYFAVLPSGRAFGIGERIEYRLRVRDFDGNQTLYPAAGEPPLVVEYLLMEEVDALADLRATGAWRGEGTTWSARTDGASDRSSLVLAPIDLPANGEDLLLAMDHRYRLGDDLAGNVKLSLDDGATWAVLAPAEGYPASARPDAAHPLRGEPAFRGTNASGSSALFDLTPYAGRQVRLRVDLGAARPLAEDEFWSVRRMSLSLATREQAFDVPRELLLHANYPDPFASSTTVGYTLPDVLPVRLAVYDLLGRRVAVLVHAEQPAGTYTYSFDGSQLASGVYLLRLEAGDRQLTEKIVVAR